MHAANCKITINNSVLNHQEWITSKKNYIFSIYFCVSYLDRHLRNCVKSLSKKNIGSLDSSLEEEDILRARIYRINCGKYLPWSTRGRLCKWFLLGYWSRRSISALMNYKAWWGKWPPSSAEVRAFYWYPLQGWYPERWYRASCNRRTPFS